MTEQTLYNTLGVSSKASDKDLRKAFHRLVKKYHPDAGPGADAEKFRQVVEAYDILSDPDSRATYDQTGEQVKSSGQSLMDEAAALMTGIFNDFFNTLRNDPNLMNLIAQHSLKAVLRADPFDWINKRSSDLAEAKRQGINAADMQVKAFERMIKVSSRMTAGRPNTLAYTLFDDVAAQHLNDIRKGVSRLQRELAVVETVGELTKGLELADDLFALPYFSYDSTTGSTYSGY